MVWVPRRRFGFDTATRWNVGELTQQKIMLRAIFLETIAAVPGFVGAMFRHFKVLRTMERDGGWTNLLLEEAENEKMHLLAFIKMFPPCGYVSDESRRPRGRDVEPPWR